MAIPDFQTIMLPLLKATEDRAVHALRDIVKRLAEEFALTEEERREFLPSGRQQTFNNRVGWARTYLTKAALLDAPKRGHFQITDRGIAALAEKPAAINIQFLRRFQEFESFRTTHSSSESTVGDSSSDEIEVESPEERLESAYQALRAELSAKILTIIKGCSPYFFERLVVDVLVRMGYGGSRKEAGQAISGSSDEGIDGIIKEDKLGLDIIYIQAKRWEATVGRPEVQKFAGALQGQRARKGIMITTSTFARGAEEYVKLIDSKIILVDGVQLAALMIDHGVGVTTESVFEVKRVDSDYFVAE